MNIRIEIRGANATVSGWSDDCASLVEGVFQLLPAQSFSRSFPTTQLRAFNFISFLKQHKVEVDLVINDPADHARMTVWTEKLQQLRTDISDSEVSRFIDKIGITFREPQVRGLKKLLQSHFALLAAGCGTGKTLLNLSVSQYKKWRHGRALTVIVAPPNCAAEYEKELNRFRGYFDLTLLNVTGMSSTAARIRISENTSDIVIVSVDSVNALANDLTDYLQSHNGESLLVVEEGHSVKNVASKRSLGVQQIAPLFDQVIVSTATPLPLGPKDLRGYVGLVGLPQPETAYSNGIPTHDLSFLRGVAFVSDEEDIPYAPLSTKNIEFRDLEDLNQQTSDEVHSELAAGHKVVIFTSTNAALATAYDLFAGTPRVVLSGSYFVADCRDEGLQSGRSKEAQESAVNQFNNDPECRILIANYRVGSTGLNLQYSGARMALFYEITNSGADFFQSKYRIRRPNTFPEGGFRYIYAVPVDPKLRKTVNKQFLKLADQQTTLKDIKRYAGGAL